MHLPVAVSVRPLITLVWMVGLILPPVNLNAQATWQWDVDSAFSVFSSGNHTVSALQEFTLNGEKVLFAGGNFTIPGEPPIQNIAVWNGSEWLPAGNGLNGEVTALFVFDEELYAGGAFTATGSQQTLGVAKWNGNGWEQVGAGFNERALTFEMFDDGNGMALYAGGWFTHSGGTELNYLAKLENDEWAAVGHTMNLFVTSLKADSSGNAPVLYAGGWFFEDNNNQHNYIASWNGSDWNSVGDGFDNFVEALELFDDGNGTVLIAGGSFRQSGQNSVTGIGRFVQGEWQAIDPEGRFANTRALFVFDDGFGEALYIGGFFDDRENLDTRNVVRWDGHHFSRLDVGHYGPNDMVYTFGAYTYPGEQQPSLFTGGFLTSAGGHYVRGISRWYAAEPTSNDSRWDPHFGRVGSDQFTRAMHLHKDAYNNPLLVVSGDMATIDGSGLGTVFAYNGEKWFTMGERTIRARHFFTLDAGSGPELYAVYPGANNFLVRWDGTEWADFGPTPFHTLYDHVIVEEDGQEVLYAVGSSGASAFFLRFDGSEWDVITQNIAAPRAISWHNGLFYVGGGFSQVDGVNIGAGVARWNPETDTWSGLDGGTQCSFPSDPGCSATTGLVRTLHIHNGYLIMGGGFSYAGGEQNNRIARYNLEAPDADWESMAGRQFKGSSPTQYFINTLATLETEEGSQLYAGGTFWLEDDGIVVNIVEWDGSQWMPLEGGLKRIVGNQDGFVNHIIPWVDENQTKIYAGGYFQKSGPYTSNNIARWFPDDRPPEMPVLLSPANRAGAVESVSGFSWQSIDEATLFEFQLATDRTFTNLAFEETGVATAGLNGVPVPDSEQLFWRVRASDGTRFSRWTEPYYFTTGVAASAELVHENPRQFRLYQNYPNPFNPVTILPFHLPAADDIRLEVYDILGRRVAILADGFTPAGHHSIAFDASGLASGVYIYRLVTGNSIFSRKMLLLK